MAERVPFDLAVEAIERGKRELVAVVPVGRAPGAPLAEALHGFESSLIEAERALAAWSDAAAPALRSAVAEAARRAAVDSPEPDRETSRHRRGGGDPWKHAHS